MLRSHDLGSLSTLCYYLILELLNVLQLLLLLHNSPLFGLFLGFGLCLSPGFLSCMLCTTCCSNHSSLKDKWSHNEQSSPMGYQVKSGGITRELDKEPSLYCSSIYTTTLWSVLQQCVYLMSIHHMFSLRPPCFLHVPWRHTLNLRCTCAHHKESLSLDVIPNPNSNLDSSRSF